VRDARIADQGKAPRPSRTNKKKLVGFDLAQGKRFNTYARHEAEKEMRMAMPWWQPPFNAIDSKIDFDKWAKTRILEHIEDARKNWTEINADPPFSHRITEAEFGEHERNRLWRDEQPPQSKVDPEARQKQIEATRAAYGIASIPTMRSAANTSRRMPTEYLCWPRLRGRNILKLRRCFCISLNAAGKSTAPGRSFPNSTDLLSVGHLIQKE
jgi:hypothetical protein